MYESPTVEDYNEIIGNGAVAILERYTREAQKIHTSGGIGFIFGRDDRFDRILDHYDSGSVELADFIANHTISFINTGKLDKVDLVIRATAAMNVAIGKMVEDLEYRLAFLAETSDQKQYARKRFERALRNESVVRRRIIIGIGSNAGGYVNSNVINAHSINGNIQQGSPGASMSTPDDLDEGKVKMLVEMAVNSIDKQSSDQNIKLILSTLQLISDELSSDKPDRSVVRSLISGAKSIFEQTAANVMGAEVTSALTLLFGIGK